MSPYLSVKNLDKYQHYKNRDPKWIKLYYSLLDDEHFLMLSEVLRARYMTLLIIASRTGNKISADPGYLRKVMRLDHKPDIQPLIDIGFLVPHPSSICLDAVYTNAPSSTLLSSTLSSPKGKESGKTPFPEGLSLAEMKPEDPKGEGWAKFGINPFIEFARFRDHALANDRRCKDWKAAWRNWARKAIELKVKSP
jgi:hypothetical protein